MLSKASSSIQKRRQTHRRQNSLEVPTLTQQLPANNIRRNQAHQHHRRGISLDNGLQQLSPGFRPLLQQDYQSMVSMDTNPGQHQHFMQEAQQHTPAQPGFQQNGFQQHLQQQLNPTEFQQLLMQHENSPQPPPQQQDMEREQDLRNLQEHIKHIQQKHGNVLTTVPTTPTFTSSQLAMPEMLTTPQHGMPQAPMAAMPNTPTSQSRTVPNTPQQNFWPSPPPTHAKHARSQSFQLDVAPMPGNINFGDVPVLKLNQSPFTTLQDSFNQDVFGGANDHDYASSSYASSVCDAMSPSHGMSQTQPLPTLFEEEASSSLEHLSHHGLSQGNMIIQADAGAEDEEMGIYFEGPLDERELLLRNMGDIDASIEDTGISSSEVQSYISPQDPTTSKWKCQWPGCDKDFGRKENIRSHVQTHLGDRQFKCNGCGKKFVRQHDLKRHARIHTGSKPHVCLCGAGFARHDALTRHRQRGCCVGALPGIEKKEVKRGRPKKEKADATTRLNKASRARAIDAAIGEEHQYASSSSGGSARSSPVTPPDTGDNYDTNPFVDLTDLESNVGTSNNSWRDTPPTSPVSASPMKSVNNTSFTLAATHENYITDAGVSPQCLSNQGSPANAPTSPKTSQDLPSMGNTAVFDDMDNFLSQDPFSPESYSGSSDSDFDQLLLQSVSDNNGDFVNFGAENFLAVMEGEMDGWI